MELTLRQKRLLELLSINSRFSNKDIAKSLNCSEDAVDYQIKKLIEQEKLSSFSIQFDYYLLDYQQYHIWLGLNDLNIDYQKLKELKEIISINTSYGKYDLQIIALVKEKQELQKIIDKIREILDIKDISFAEYFDSIRKFTNIIPPIITNTKIPKNRKNPIYELNSKEFIMSKDRSLIKLDSIDKRIIKELINEPRIKFSDLSEKTNINHETIRYRINNYVKRGLIINFGLLHDFQKYGLYTTYILANLKSIDEKLKRYLERNPNVFYSAHLIGAYNAIIYIVSKDPLDLGEKLKELIEVMKGNLLNMDLLQMEKIHKYVQFPLKELE